MNKNEELLECIDSAQLQKLKEATEVLVNKQKGTIDFSHKDIFGMNIDHVERHLGVLKNGEDFPKNTKEYFLESDLTISLLSNDSDTETINKYYQADKVYYNFLRYTLGFFEDSTPSVEEYEENFGDVEYNAKQEERYQNWKNRMTKKR